MLRVNPRDVVELAAALRRLTEQPELCRSARARRGGRRRRAITGAQAAEATLAEYRAVQLEA